MAQLPRYQRLGVKTRQPQNLDFADTREQAALSQNLSQQLNRMSNFAFQKAGERAVERGEERVQEEGAIATLGDIDKRGGPRTIADKAAYALGSRVAVAEVQNAAEIEISRILTEAEKSGTAFSTVQSQLADVTDGYSESLRVIDPAASSVLKVNLEGATGKATERYSNYYVKLQAQRQAAKRSEAADRSFNSVLSDAILPGMTVEKLGENIAAEADLLLGLGATEKQADAFYEKTFNAAYREKLTYDFNTAPLEEKQRLLTAMETTALPGMSLTQTQSVRKSLNADYNSALQVTRGESNSIVSSVNEYEILIAKGGKLPLKAINNLQDRADNLGDQGAAASAAIAELEFNAENATTYRKMNVEELASEVNDLKSGITGMGGSGIDTLLEAETLQVAQAYLTAANKSIKNAATEQKAEFQPKIDAANAQLKTLQDVVDEGIAVDINALTDLLSDINDIPDSLTDGLQDELNTLIATGDLGNTLREYTPSQVANYISGLQEEGVDTAIELKQLNLAEKMLKNMEIQLADDPLTYAMNVVVLDSNGKPVQIDGILPTAESMSLVANLKKRVVDAQIIASKYNIEPKYFTSQERDLLTEFLRSGGASGTMPDSDPSKHTSNRLKLMGFLGALVEGGGSATPDMLAELSKTAPAFAGIGALMSEGRPTAANHALRGKEYIDAGNKPAGLSDIYTEPEFKGMTSQALRFSPDTETVIRENAELIYADLAREEIDFNAEKWVMSIEMATGMQTRGRKSYGGIQEVRGRMTLLPPDVTPDDLEDALSSLTSEMAFEVSGINLSPGILNAIPNNSDFQVISAGGDKAAITFGKDAYGTPTYIKDSSGNPFFFDISNLVDLSKASGN